MAVNLTSQDHVDAWGDMSLSYSELDAEWERYVVHGIAPERVRPVIWESWRRCRELYHVDPYVQTPLILLNQDDAVARTERSEVLRLARPIIDGLMSILSDTGYAISFYDAEGWLLHTQGHPKLLEMIPGNFNVIEEFVGTTASALAMVQRQPIQVRAAEFYRMVYHSFSGCSTPILYPISRELAGVLSVGGYKESVHPNTLLAVWTAAHHIEQKLQQEQMLKEQQLMNDYWKMSARRPHDGLLCIDQQGNLLQINPTASHIFGIPEMSNTLDACPSMKHILLPLVRQTHPRSEPHEHQFFCARSDKHLNVTTFPIIREGQTIGAIALVPGQDATGSSCNQCKDRVVDSAEEKITRRTRLNRVQARYSFENILGEVGEVKRALELAKLAATNSLPVLITGESGTGKELFAQAIHNTNRRARHSFVVVNCGAIPHELIEAELFGYESGAFTGAKPGGSAGKFESADGGTIFLDEVSELSHSAQVALLRVLQEMEIVRLGSSLPTAIDVRVIAASNKDLSQEVNARRFRRDLYYRLNVMHIDLPPLRQRQDDIPLLVNHMLQMVAREFGQLQFTLDPEVIELLRAYHWPGNIRELKNVIQRAAALSKGSLICLKDLPTEVKAAKSEEAAGESHGWPSIKHLERELLVETLQACSGNVTEAAHRLHLSRVTLHRKMRKYSITRQDFLGMRPHADDHATKT